MLAALNVGGNDLINAKNIYGQGMRLEQDANIRGHLKVNGTTETNDLNVLNDTQTRNLKATTARVDDLAIQSNGRVESIQADLSDGVSAHS